MDIPLFNSVPLYSPLLHSAPLCSVLLPFAPLRSPLLHSAPLCSTLLPSIPAAPGPVRQLVIRHADETTLSVLWSRPVGEWDSFTVLLRQKDPPTEVARRILPWESRECTFNILTPGCQYTVTVMTNSGDLTSSANVTTWTSASENNHIYCKK